LFGGKRTNMPPMTDMPTLPPGWLFKVEDHQGDPLARYIMARIPDPEEAGFAVATAVPEKLVHLERNLTDGEVTGMRPGEVCQYSR
jgi:hypothetical protein